MAQKIQQELPSGFLTEGFFVEAIVLIPMDPLWVQALGLSNLASEVTEDISR